MTRAIPRSRSRKVKGYVKAALALDAARRRREDRYERFVRPLDRRREALTAEVRARFGALSGGQQAEASRILADVSRGLRGGDGPGGVWKIGH